MTYKYHTNLVPRASLSKNGFPPHPFFEVKALGTRLLHRAMCEKMNRGRTEKKK